MTIKSKDDQKTEINSRYADNAINAIGAEDVRIISTDSVDSALHEWDGYNLTDTGITVGGELSVNANETTFDLTAGYGYIVDNVTNPELPTKTKVTWTGYTAEVVTNIATQPTTYIGIEDTGSGVGGIVQQSTEFSQSQLKSIIEVGRLSHFNNSTIRQSPRLVNPTFNPNSLALSLSKCIGAKNCRGNNYSAASTDLTLARNSGVAFRAGVNWGLDNSNVNMSTSPDESPVTFSYIYEDGTGGFNIVPQLTAVDGGSYDDGSGVLQTVGPSQYSVQRIYFFPGSNTTVIQYGPSAYASLTEAKANLFFEDHAEFPDVLDGAIYRCALVLRGNVSDLSDSGNADFANFH